MTFECFDILDLYFEFYIWIYLCQALVKMLYELSYIVTDAYAGKWSNIKLKIKFTIINISTPGSLTGANYCILPKTNLMFVFMSPT